MTLLLLGGTGEARALAARLAEVGVPVLVSLAGAVRDLPDYAVPTRVGGFGGAEGFLQCLQDAGITAVLDATHPFAARITERTAQLCRQKGIPYARLSRPAWTPGPGDRWREVADVDAAVARIRDGARVFLATGAQDVARFARLAGRAQVLCRRAEDPGKPFPFAGGSWIVGRGPFAVAEEVALLRKLGITQIVTKNAGGQGARAKLDAARELGIPVILIARPPDPAGVPVLHTLADAMAWAQVACPA